MVLKDLIKFEDLVVINVEVKLFDFFNIDEVLYGGNQEVLLFFIVMGVDVVCFFDIDLLFFDYKFQGNDYLVLVDLFVVFFKGKVVFLQIFFDDSDQFFVFDVFNFCFDVEIFDFSIILVDVIIGFLSEVFFYLGDIFGFDGFESFVLDLSVFGNFGLNLD